MNDKIHTHLRRTGDYKYEVTFDEWDGKLVMDEPEPLGESAGASASMVLSSAVGHCLSSSLIFCLEKSRVKMKDLKTDVETTFARNEKGRWRISGIKVKMNPIVDEIDRKNLERCLEMFEDFCIATASIRQGIKVDVEIEKN